MTDKELRNQLLYISTSIAIGNYDATHIQNKLDELIQDVRNHSFKYLIQFSYDARGNKSGHDKHVPTYTNYANRSKAKSISMLEDARTELSAIEPNNRFILFLVRKVLTTDFFQVSLQQKMSSKTFTTQKAVMISEPLLVK